LTAVNDISSFLAFSQNVEKIASDLFARMVKPSDDDVARRVIFKDALSMVFTSLTQTLFRERKSILNEGERLPDQKRRLPIGLQKVLWSRPQINPKTKRSFYSDTLGIIQSQRFSSSEINELFDILNQAVRGTVCCQSIPIEFLGMVFEELYGTVPELDEDGTYHLRGSTQRRDGGVFFTPPELVKFLTRLTLDPLLAKLKSPADLLSLRIVDPAMGAGFFLLESLRLLSAKLVDLSGGSKNLSPSEARYLVAMNCLYGVDVDPLAVNIAKALIWLEIGDERLSSSFIDHRIKVGDSLLGLPPERFDGIAHCSTPSKTPARAVLLSSIVAAKLEGDEIHAECIRQLLDKKNKSAQGQELIFRPFCWELAFPEVFLDSKGRRKKDGGFTVVLSNPPWGKIKPDIKEFYAHIDERVSQYQGLSLRRYIKNNGSASKRALLKTIWNQYVAQTKCYASLLQSIDVYKAQRVEVNGRSTGGDADLYKYFMERAFQLLSPNGRIGLVVPSAFHRSEGATGIRHLYWEGGTFEQFLEFENKKRLFPIHGMFRFLLMTYQRGRRNGIRNAAFGLSTIKEAIETSSRNSSKGVRLTWNFPKRVSGDLLTIPEIRSKTEQTLFEKLHSFHPMLGDTSAGGWNISFVRELDMTNDSEAFRNKTQLVRLKCKENADGSWTSPQEETYLPLFEGRMVHQYDYAAKAYRGGEGRTAQWIPLQFKEKAIIPHYYVAASYIERNKLGNILPRAGFCDITGHANERTVLASLIPQGFPCGNKVPTCEFDSSDPRIHLIWLAIANSFVVDWIVRRRISITLNFFHWHQVPFPRVNPDSDIGCELAAAAARLSYLQLEQTRTIEWLRRARCSSVPHQHDLASLAERAHLRANIDAIVADLFNLTYEEFAAILSDFQILDRYQPAIPHEGNHSRNGNGKSKSKSTITRDKALLSLFQRRRDTPPANISELPGISAANITSLEQRVNLAEQEGAVAYIPSELAAM
jgi:N-6 DNA Methylase